MNEEMSKWYQIASISYYTGVGVTLLGTGLRFLWRYLKERSDDQQFTDDLRDIHLPNIYGALRAITKKLDIEWEPTPGPKPLKRTHGQS